jgi:hypothetical protein
MAKSQTTLLTINVSTNVQFTPEMLFQLQQTVSSKFDVTAVVVPNPSISKLVEVTSDTADQDTINNIEVDSTTMLIQLIEVAAQANQ